MQLTRFGIRWRAGPAIFAAALFVSAALTGCASHSFFFFDDPLTITGTFSDLHFDSQRDSLVGTEIRIVPADCLRQQATIQFAQGEGAASEPSALIVVDVIEDFQRIPLNTPYPPFLPDTSCLWFTIPPGTGHASTFFGIIFRDRLEGVFSFPDGRQMQVVLPRVARGLFE